MKNSTLVQNIALGGGISKKAKPSYFSYALK